MGSGRNNLPFQEQSPHEGPTSWDKEDFWLYAINKKNTTIATVLISGFGRSPPTRHLSNRKAELKNSQMDPYISTFWKHLMRMVYFSTSRSGKGMNNQVREN